jgi:hypothetical protein
MSAQAINVWFLSGGLGGLHYVGISHLIFVMENFFVLFEVGIECLNIIWILGELQRAKELRAVTSRNLCCTYRASFGLRGMGRLKEMKQVPFCLNLLKKYSVCLHNMPSCFLRYVCINYILL